MTDQSGGVRALRLAEQRGTLCDQCAEQHRATIEFAATIIDIELAGRRRSQAAADLRAMLPPRHPRTDRRCGMTDTSADLANALHNEREARKIAGSAADRFRDVITEVLDLDENPGDDELVAQLRARHGKSGPEPTAFRDFCSGAIAHLEANGHRWQADAALNGLHEFHPHTTHNPGAAT